MASSLVAGQSLVAASSLVEEGILALIVVVAWSFVAAFVAVASFVVAEVKPVGSFAEQAVVLVGSSKIGSVGILVVAYWAA